MKQEPSYRSIHYLCGLGFVLQGPLLAINAKLSMVSGAVVVLVMFLIAKCVLVRIKEWSVHYQMIAVMLGLGNLGMLLGWMIDAGSGGILREGICVCGCSKSVLGKGLIGQFRWMHIAMLSTSLPAMIGLDQKKTSWIQVGLLTIGMLVGMQLGALGPSLLPISHPQLHFVITFLLMNVGMIFGMHLVLIDCETWFLKFFFK